MSRILYFLTPAKGQREAAESEAEELDRYCFQTERIVHDLRNCISVLLLVITSLKDNQALISESRKQTLKNVVAEMDHLVNELVQLTGRRMTRQSEPHE